MNRVATQRTREPHGASALLLAEKVSLHVDAVRRTAFRITRSHGAAQEISQDVMLRVCRLGGFDPARGSFDGWLQTVTHFTTIDWIRRESAEQRRTERVGAMHIASNAMVEDVVADRARATNLHVAVALLPDDEREVISMAYFDELTYRQVAERLGLPEGTVKSRMRRALTRLAHTASLATPMAT